MRIASTAVLLIASWSVSASAQTPRFAVASIHSTDQAEVDRGEAPDVSGGPGTAAPGRITYSRMPLSVLISIAFGIRPDRIVGSDPDLRSQYNITASVEPGTPKEDIAPMLRALLEERFELKAHLEKRTAEIYRIVIAKDGIKFKESRPTASDEPLKDVGAPDKDGFPILPPSYSGTVARPSNGRLLLRGQNVSVPELIRWLEPGLGKVAVDGTGLTGKYDFKVTFRSTPLWSNPAAPSPGDNDPGDTAFDALSLLGLRPEQTTAQVDFVVIDSVRKYPTPN